MLETVVTSLMKDHPRMQDDSAKPQSEFAHRFTAGSPAAPAARPVKAQRRLTSADGRWRAGDAVWISDVSPHGDWVPALIVEFLPAEAPLSERVVTKLKKGIGLTCSVKRIIRVMTSEDIAESSPWMLEVEAA